MTFNRLIAQRSGDLAFENAFNSVVDIEPMKSDIPCGVARQIPKQLQRGALFAWSEHCREDTDYYVCSEFA